MSALRVGILGPGGIAARHAGAIRALCDEMQLVAACGRDAARTQAFIAAEAPDAAAFTDLDAMLDACSLDLLIVALPPFAHNGEVERAAARGVHLLVEKPIALDVESARRMVAAVEASGVVAAVGFIYRFGGAVQRWRALQAQGLTGRSGLFAGSFHCNALHAPWWRQRDKSGGQMVEQVIHLIDLVRHLIGEPDSVYARAANLFHQEVPDYDAEDVSAIVFGWDDGRIATLNASNIAVPGRWAKEWLTASQQMTGRFSDWNNAVLTRTHGEAAQEVVAAAVDPFLAQLEDVARAIRSSTSPQVPLREGYASLRLALAARLSAALGRELRLEDADAV